jgi:transposase
MPQLQLPIFPAGSRNITNEIAVECQGRTVIYSHGMMPMFQHEKADIRSFRMFTSELINIGAARQGDIAKTFGVPLSTVKRYLKLLREQGPEAFFAEPRRRSASVLNGEARESVESLLREGRSVPEVAQATGIMANTLHKAIRAGRLPGVQKKLPPPTQQATFRPKANAARPTALH